MRRSMKRRRLLLAGFCALLAILVLQLCLVWLIPNLPSVNTARVMLVARLQQGQMDVEHSVHLEWDTKGRRRGGSYDSPPRVGIGLSRKRQQLQRGVKKHPKEDQQSQFMSSVKLLNASGSVASLQTTLMNNDPYVQRKLSILHQPWTADTRDALLETLEPSLFTDEISATSDSVCYLPVVVPPAMCGHMDWDCSLSPTFLHHDRVNRTLQVNCDGEFRVNFVSREESETRLASGKFMPDRQWHTHYGPKTVSFPSQYADVVCPIKDGDNIVDHHNYRTQFIPNITAIKQQKVTFEKIMTSHQDWQPLSILSINLDSMSRPHFHRPCGLPKTAKLIRDLYSSPTQHKGKAGTKKNGSKRRSTSHQAFLFNRLNSIGGVTAMNLTPLYAGLYLRRSEEEKRVLLHRYPRKIKEWMWDYANSLGFLTSYGVDTGNGLFGTRTTCKTCTNRPGSLPHWEDGWVKKENQQVRPGVLAGLCDGDTLIHEHIMNYTQDFLNSDYPAKWAAFDVNAKHRPEPESATQIDESLVRLLTELMESQPNLVIFLFGDHGDRYHGNHTDHAGSYLEIFLPFLSIIVPRYVLEAQPQWERNLLINSQRYLVHYDIHNTMKSLMHYPALDKVSGQIAKVSYNLFTQVVPRSRTCSDANMPYWSCVCGGPKFLAQDRWTDEHYTLARVAVEEINEKHSKESLLHEDPNNMNLTTSCMDVELANISSIAAYEHEYAGVFTAYYHITFTSKQGPSTWQVTIDNKASIDSLKQVTRYQKYEECQDHRVSIEFCVCHQFPDGTP